jgi:hypothetical protein
MTTIAEKTGKLKWKISTTWWVEFLQDWTYTLSLVHVFNMGASWETSAAIQAVYWQKALIPILTQAAKEWDAHIPVYFDAIPFWATAWIRNFTVTGNFVKGNVVYLEWDHRRDTIGIPTTWGLYITKL